MSVPVDQALGQLADYLHATLLDESQKITHDESCSYTRHDLYGPARCDCDATAEWKAAIESIMKAVDALRYTEDPLHSLLVMQALAEPYKKGQTS